MEQKEIDPDTDTDPDEEPGDGAVPAYMDITLRCDSLAEPSHAPVSGVQAGIAH
jgi:hypothetical protein